MEDVLNLESIYSEGKINWEALTFVLKTIQEGIENQSDDLVPAIYEYYFTTGWGTKKHLPLLENRIEQTKNSLVSILQKGINDKVFSPKNSYRGYSKNDYYIWRRDIFRKFPLRAGKGEV